MTVVVGAGPTGLAVADALAGRGIDVTVLEADDVVGGMARSITVDGIRCDLGSHRLHPVAEPAVERLITELLGADLQVRPRHGRMRLRDRWVGFPISPTAFTSLPPSFVVRAGLDTLLSPLRSPSADTFAEVVRAGLGPTMLREFYGPFARKLWGEDPAVLAGELARRRIAASTPGKLLAKLAPSRTGAGSTFRYPRDGYGTVVERLADRATARGAALRTGTRVVRVEPGPAPVVHLHDGTTIETDRLFWTAPVGALADVVEGAPTHRPRHRGMVCAFVTVPAPQVSPFDAHYLPGLELTASRISEPKNYRDGDDPHDRTVLCAELPCTVGDDIWTADDEGIATLVAADLERLGMAGTGPVATTSVRLPRVYPVLRAGDLVPHVELTGWGHRQPGITVLGRQGLTVADNLHHVLAMALDAAGCLAADGGWDGASWARSLARFSEFTVED